MKKFKKLLQEEITDEMIKWFNQRTQNHIKLVNKYSNLIIRSEINKLINVYLFINDCIFHDISKLYEPERTPYIYISWDYHCKALNIPYNIPDNIIEQTNKITNLHVCSNRHHPEYWIKNKALNVINKLDWNQPNNFILNCTNMPLTYIASMCADWMAISEEKNTNPYDWAQKNINIRWKFTKNQENFIYKILDTIWNN